MGKTLNKVENMGQENTYSIEIMSAIIGAMLYFMLTGGSGFYLITVDWIAYVLSLLEMGAATVICGILGHIGKKLGEKIWKKVEREHVSRSNEKEHTGL